MFNIFGMFIYLLNKKNLQKSKQIALFFGSICLNPNLVRALLPVIILNEGNWNDDNLIGIVELIELIELIELMNSWLHSERRPWTCRHDFL